MLAQCIDQFRQGACATCNRRDDCPLGWWEQLAGRFAERRSEEAPARATGRPNLFAILFGEVAKAIERNARAQSSSPPPSQAQSQPRSQPRLRRFRAELERQLEPMLESGDIRIEQIARGLGVSRQTLYRRLKEEGVTFAELLDQLRQRLALRYLREQGLSVKETAYRLGFSDPAAFSRAFKRWTGSSPRTQPR